MLYPHAHMLHAPSVQNTHTHTHTHKQTKITTRMHTQTTQIYIVCTRTHMLYTLTEHAKHIHILGHTKNKLTVHYTHIHTKIISYLFRFFDTTQAMSEFSSSSLSCAIWILPLKRCCLCSSCDKAAARA
jgi:hypothetical protein